MDRRLDVYRTAVVAVFFAVALFAFSGSALAADNSTCLTCHGPTLSMPVPDVNRDTACKACHVDGLVGTHPYHQPGADCGAACHPGWGDSILTAVPSYTDPISGASFASSTSKATSPAVLHIIHSAARWPQNVNTSFSACSSCHATAACTACHTGAVSATHANHSATGNASYPAQTPWTGMVGYGVTGGNQAQQTAAVETNQCAIAGCHNLEGTRARRPNDVEDYNYAVGGNPENPTGTNTAITLIGAWRYKASSVYTGARMSYNNVAGSALTATFTGERVDIVSDRDPYRGKADVYIDGAKVATIDTYAAATVNQAVVYSSGTLAGGPTHTISVRPLNTKSASARATYVVIDAFRVYASVPDSIAPGCLDSCHADKSTGHGATFSHEATHTAGVESGFACTSCHSLNMFTEHGRTSSSSDAASCNACHTTYAPFTLSEYDFTCGGTGNPLDTAPQPCHSNAGQVKHEFMATGHDASAVANGADCRGCHGSDLATVHTAGSGRAYDAALSANSYATNCLTCHSTTAVPTTKDCTSSLCHSASFGGAAVTMDNHKPVAHPATNNGQTDVPTTGGFACSTCHTLELPTEHSKAASKTTANAAIVCSTCHSASYLPTNWMDTPGTTNTCTACHPVAGGKAGAPHEAADYSSKHDLSTYGTNASCGSTTVVCHSGSTALLGNMTDVTTLHAASKPGNADCTSCHGTGGNKGNPPTVKACATCHTTGHNTGPAHNSDATAQPDNAACIGCHSTYTNIMTGHPFAFNCQRCHDNAILTAGQTRYLGGTFSTRCLDCHTGTVLGAIYDPTDPNHYDPHLDNHTAVGMTTPIGNKTCQDCHATTLKAEHAITVSAGVVDCIGCHTDATLGSATVVANNWPTDTCADCHALTHDTMGTSHTLADNAACAGADCHANTDNLATLHSGAVDASSRTSCNVCHTNGADTDLSTKTSCLSVGCHVAHDMTVHAVTVDTGSCLNCHGNDGTPANDVRGVHATCATCHANPSYPGITTGKTSDCTSCHNATLVAEPHAGAAGAYTPYDPNHYLGTETTHTVSGAQAATLYDGYACSACHKTEMKPEHFKTSSLVPGADKCVGCHEVKVDTLGTWDDTCDACHTATPHNERATKHDVTASSCTAVSGCHSQDISVIHAESIPTNSMHPSCATCHTNNTTVPTELSCGAVGCHAGMSAHAHTLGDSTYNNTTVAGCTDSGAGCHGATPANYQVIHPNNGCTSGACHAAANHNDPQFNDPNTCQNCHGGGATIYQGAPDVVSLMDTGTAGHYNETTHTATAMNAAVYGTTNGTASATCTDCHNGASAGPDGYYTQHQGIRIGAGTGSLTCYDCHNKNAAIQTIVTDTTRTDTCAACHDGTIVEAQHAAGNAPVVNGSSIVGCGATGTNCHTTYDLHTLHKDAGSCNLSGCHDYTKQGVKPTTTTCGQVAGCHSTYTVNNHSHASDAALHAPTTTTQADVTTFNSVACGSCHDIRTGVTSLTNEHALSTSAKSTDATNVCRNCHNNAASTTAITGNWAARNTDTACTTCHTGALAVHADKNSTVHSDVVSAGCSSSGVGCHNTSDLSNVGATTVVNTNIHSTCLRCHDRTATAPNQAYNPANDTCGSGRECHATVGQYDTSTLVHNGAGGTANGDDADHHTATGMTNTVDGTTYDVGGGNTCASCHSSTLKTSHATSSVGAVSCTSGGTGNLGCHNSTAVAAAPTQVKASWTNNTCADCHTTSHTTYTAASHTALLGTPGTADGCANTGCHKTGGTADVRVIHNRAVANRGCTSTGTDSNLWSGSCHDLNKAMTSGTIGCGSGTTATTKCHVNHTNTNHMPAHDASDATSIGCTTSGCHETLSVITIHAGVGDGCQPCHGGGGYTDIHTTAGNFQCVTCHNGTLVGTHVYTPYDGNHYYTASHDSSLTTGATFGNGNGQALNDYHGNTLTWSNTCTSCHSIDMKAEHFKTSSAFSSVPGTYVDKCVACHEIKVDTMTGAWTGSCSGDAAGCHSLANGTLHNNWSTKHDASAASIPTPGNTFTAGGSTQVEFENFGTTTTWPSDYTRNNSSYVVAATGSGAPSGGSYAEIVFNTTRTEYNFYKDIILTGYSSANVSFWYQVNVSGTTDYLIVEYSTNGGTSYTQLFRRDTDQLTWASQPAISLPAGGTVRLRVRGTFNASGEYGRIDDITVTGTKSSSWGSAIAAPSTAAISCMNNPNAGQCHDVTDVSDIHSSITGRTDNGCGICHTNNTTVPTTLACQDTGCHPSINGSSHDTTWHESAISNTTLFGTGFAASWCMGCHDDSIDNEHYVLGAYGASPCSVCHKKNGDSAAPTSVTAANTASAIHGDSTPGNVLCTQCHTTVTKTAPHVQRAGNGGTPGTQFLDTWSGHKIFNSSLGSGTSFAPQGTTLSWPLPTGTWLNGPTWTTTSMVRCSDCHGSVSGATGPHGASMVVNYAIRTGTTPYDNSYTSGTLALSNGSMSNTTNLCIKCHPQSLNVNGGPHGKSDHNISCTSCHVKIPHMWKRPRLIGYLSDPAPYASTQVNSIRAKAYDPNAANWAKTDCGAACTTGTHPQITGTSLWP